MEACNHCYSACLQEKDVEMMAECIRLDRECADICGFAAQAMQRNSRFAKEICNVCAHVCQACGDECAKHEHDHCQRCAEICHHCANVCQDMAV
ncbi:four-helix bundle copper-binding protein [Salibacterium salarium]|uniref:Four-helix bundle copper-binding protein n=2 Tax=Salibacterium salarium TaxID=284579 RepID=A0A428MTU2_9BACI|nr:four-helix bundle copper-binding protein [Salibacterium salarium]